MNRSSSEPFSPNSSSLKRLAFASLPPLPLSAFKCPEKRDTGEFGDLVSFFAYSDQVRRATGSVPSELHTLAELEARFNAIPEVGIEAKEAIERLNDWFFSLVDPESLNAMIHIGERHPDEFEPLRTIVSTNCDSERTRKFCQGVSEATRDLLRSRKGIVHVVDAGSGPFGIMGIVAAMQNPRVHVTMIELSEAAIATSSSIVKNLGLEDRVKVVKADAKKFVPFYQIDLLISETMDAGLFNEPVLDIVRHLKKYVRQDGIVIPEYVELEFGLQYRLGPVRTGGDKCASPVETSFMPFNQARFGLVKDRLPTSLMFFIDPGAILEKFDSSHVFTTRDFVLQTTIGVYGQLVIYPGTSVITRSIGPKRVDDYSQRNVPLDLKLNPSSDRSYSIHYHAGQRYEGPEDSGNSGDFGFCLQMLRAPVDR